MLRPWALVVIVCTGVVAAQEKKAESPKIGPEHEFLKRFVGNWDCEVEAFLEPGMPPMKSKSTMTGHMIGNYWAIVVVHGEALGMSYHGQATFGYDSMKKKKYIGTWADSTSDFLWHYEGVVDGTKLVLDSEGPNPAEPGKMVKARDTWEFKGKDQVILTGEMLGPDGKMMVMMTATCTRKQ